MNLYNIGRLLCHFQLHYIFYEFKITEYLIKNKIINKM